MGKRNQKLEKQKKDRRTFTTGIAHPVLNGKVIGLNPIRITRPPISEVFYWHISLFSHLYIIYGRKDRCFMERDS